MQNFFRLIDSNLDKSEVNLSPEGIGLFIVQPDEHLIRIRIDWSLVGFAAETEKEGEFNWQVDGIHTGIRWHECPWREWSLVRPNGTSNTSNWKG